MGKKQIYPILSLALLVITLIAFSFFLNHMNSVDGIYHHDIFHSAITPIDFSIPIFVIIYGCLILFLFMHLKKVTVLHMFIHSYILLTLFRMITIFFLPLSEPNGVIRLNDPLLNGFFYQGNYCARDLFFSGHTATIFLFVFFSIKKWKWIFISCGIILAILLVWQRVHYTVDVLAAPLFAWAAFYLSQKNYLKLISVNTGR